MAKELGKVTITIRGTKADGPTMAVASYHCQDSGDPTMRGPRKEKIMDLADLSKKGHDAGTAGELFTDLIAAIETDEEIS